MENLQKSFQRRSRSIKMVVNFEQWKTDILDFYNKAMYCDDADGAFGEKFVRCVDLVEYSPTEEIADVLFSLFTDNEDYGLLQSVINQLDCMSDRELFVKCLLKAIPKLVIDAKKWIQDFLHSIVSSATDYALIVNSKNTEGKMALAKFINTINELPESFDINNSEMVRLYLKLKVAEEDLENFKKLAAEIEASMK
jgi:hypothetical protein